jgi:nucleotide-binding universal stress UspA family protein
MEVKHILVPMDFSDCAINALKTAVELAHQWKGKVFIAHALQIPESYMTIAGTYTPVDYESIQEEVNHSFDTLIDKVPALKSIPYETHELSVDLLEGIFSLVQSKQIDLIIMGTRAQHDRLERLIGTHASEVIESTHIPVLMIPGNITDLQIKKIGFATDGKSIVNTSRLSYIASFAEYFGSEVETFFIGKKGENIDFENSNNKKVIERYFQTITHTFVNVESDNILNGMINHVSDSRIDALVMIPRHHDLFYKWIHGSTTKHMAQHLTIPLLALTE